MVLLSHPPLISTTTPSQFLLPNPPPHSSAYASRTRRRFAVLCNAENHKDNNNNSPNKTGGDRPIDRRNVLLGLGGLYGTTNLLSTNFSPALATPISAPDLRKCSRGTDLNTKEPLDFNCCPHVLSDRIIDYELPKFTTVRLRPAAHLVDEIYVAKYEEAVKRMKALDEKDPTDPRSFMQQANVHCAYCNLTYEQNGAPSKKLQIHHSWLFFPWHRWYLYFYERILGKLINDPTFSLPFWNWDNPLGMVVPDYFKIHGSPLFDEKRNLDHMCANATVDLAYSGKPPPTDRMKIIKKNLSVMYKVMVSNARFPEDFYGAKYVTGSTDQDSGQGTVERGPHNALHIWVGERSVEGYDMGNFSTAGYEPLFFSHHANVDRLWSIRRCLAPKRQQFNDPELLDATFVFYDENAQLVRVKVRDAMDHKSMGYEFQDVEIPWLENRPIARVKKSKVAAKSNNVPKASGTGVFPVTLDKVFKVLVDRPKRSRSKKEKEEQEELLVIEGIEVEAPRFVRFDVFVNDEEDKPDEFDKAEYAGGFSQVPHKNSNKVRSKIRLALTDLLEDLDVDDDDQILVTLAPKAGGENVSIGGVKIIYAP